MNILLAFDGSPAALHACRLVAGYRGDRSALHVTLLNVQRPLLRLSPGSGLHHALLTAALIEQGERELASAMALLVASGQQCDALVRTGQPADTILQVAQESQADVIVMGCGRHGLLRGYAMGSVALRVAPAATCPVVLVQPDAQLPAELGKSLRVAAPVDGSAEAVQAVGRLVSCAGLLGRMHVDLVHFRPGLTLAAAVLPPHNDVLEEWGGQSSNAALELPAQMLAQAGIAHETHRLTGEPETDIASFAASQGAELIVMGTRGTGAMHHLVFGSAALKTALISHVPVAFC